MLCSALGIVSKLRSSCIGIFSTYCLIGVQSFSSDSSTYHIDSHPSHDATDVQILKPQKKENSLLIINGPWTIALTLTHIVLVGSLMNVNWMLDIRW